MDDINDLDIDWADDLDDELDSVEALTGDVEHDVERWCDEADERSYDASFAELAAAVGAWDAELAD